MPPIIPRRAAGAPVTRPNARRRASRSQHHPPRKHSPTVAIAAELDSSTSTSEGVDRMHLSLTSRTARYLRPSQPTGGGLRVTQHRRSPRPLVQRGKRAQRADGLVDRARTLSDGHQRLDVPAKPRGQRHRGIVAMSIETQAWRMPA
jgi:hypothetical protein